MRTKRLRARLDPNRTKMGKSFGLMQEQIDALDREGVKVKLGPELMVPRGSASSQAGVRGGW